MQNGLVFIFLICFNLIIGLFSEILILLFKPYKMKILIVILLSFTINSQAQVYFSINAGPNISNLKTKVNGTDDGYKSASGFIISGGVNIPIGTTTVFQTGLQYESVHTKIDNSTTQIIGGNIFKETFTARWHLNYINIPVKIYYKLPPGKNTFMFGVGPFIGIGVSGKSSSTDITETTIGGTTTRNEDDYSEKTKFGSADTTVKRMNFGVGMNASCILASNLVFSLYSNLGLSNINNHNSSSTKTFAAGITIGYIFGNKNKGVNN